MESGVLLGQDFESCLSLFRVFFIYSWNNDMAFFTGIQVLTIFWGVLRKTIMMFFVTVVYMFSKITLNK